MARMQVAWGFLILILSFAASRACQYNTDCKEHEVCEYAVCVIYYPDRKFPGLPESGAWAVSKVMSIISCAN